MKRRGKNDSQLILKALSGTQSGVEVALTDGEYTLGSGQDDDLQFVDVCLKSGHARIRIEEDKILVAGGAGTVVNEAGMVIDAGDDEWRELEPLEVVTIGASSFAIGPADADWADLSARIDRQKPSGRKQDVKRESRAGGKGWLKYGLAASSLLALVLAVIWLTLGSLMADKNFIATANTNGVETVRAALDRFPFGKSIDLREEVDGTIYATGYVEEPAERRALHDAVDETGVSANLRLGVLSSIRTQVSAAIESFGVDVTFDVTKEGVAAFDGEILSDEKSERFFDYIRGEVRSISSVESNVKTASTYFAEVEGLAERSGIDDTVLLRLQDERIEASGVVVTDKVDSYVGFIQSYANRYADHIPLTSYVQLVDEQGRVISQSVPTYLGPSGGPGENGATKLNLARLKQGGVLGASDLFRNPDDDGLVTGAVPEASSGETARGKATSEDIVDEEPQAAAGLSLARTDLSKGVRDLLSNSDRGADEVLKNWDGKAAVSDEAGEGDARQRYLPLVLTAAAGADRCWEGSRLKVTDIPAVLFWLDYLSLSKSASLVDFEQKNQFLLLEAALNPSRTRQCAKKLASAEGVHFDQMSLFLDEAERNPFFIRYLVRDFVPPALDVSGVMLQERERFIQMRDGTKVHEGSSPNVESKLMSVGALGALLQRDNNVTPIVYSDNLAWKMTY